MQNPTALVELKQLAGPVVTPCERAGDYRET